MSGCNESNITTGILCTGSDCGKSCLRDDECSGALYCGADGTCSQDCLPGGEQCGDLLTCNERGRCVKKTFAMPDGGQSCADIDVKLTPVKPRVMLLIDQSGSMTADFGMGMNRWQAVRYALTHPMVGAVTALESSVYFAAMLYTSNNGGPTCPILTRSMGMPAGHPSLNNRAAIDQLLSQNMPINDTPTGEAVDGAVKDMKAWPVDPDDPGPKVLLLATDGEPDTCDRPNPNDGYGRTPTEMAVQRAYTAGIRTYLLSVGTQAAATEDHFARMANAGVGKPLTPRSAPFYRANSPSELVRAFNEIIRGVRDCRITLNGEVQEGGAAQGVVTLNQMSLTYMTDWTLVGRSILELKGKACEILLGAENVSLKARFPCGAIIIK